MGKEKFPYFTFSASILAMLALIVLTVMEFVTYIEIAALEKLDNLTHADYCGSEAPLALLGMWYPVVALFGLATSWYCGANTTTLWINRASFIMLGVCIAVLFPFCALLIGWVDPAWVIIQIAKWFANLFV